ncbi:MAG: DUF432 domain-containing protein [Nitrososphaerales archaeon]
MSSDRVTEKEVSSSSAEELEEYGELTVERKVEKHFGNVNLVIFRVDHSKYGYQRFENGSLTVEKVIASDRALELGIVPIAPLNLPTKYGSHLMLRLRTPLVLDPKLHVDAYLTMPVEVGVVRANRDDAQIIDAFSVGQPKYALYGTPEMGIICRYYETRINPEIPKIAPHEEAVVRVHFHNQTDKINTINRIVFPIEGADFFYRKNEAYYSDLEVNVEESVFQTIITMDVANAEWVGSKTNLKQKFEGKYVMEWGF